MITCTDTSIYKYGVQIALKLNGTVYWKHETGVIHKTAGNAVSFKQPRENVVENTNFYVHMHNNYDMLPVTEEEIRSWIRSR